MNQADGRRCQRAGMNSRSPRTTATVQEVAGRRLTDLAMPYARWSSSAMGAMPLRFRGLQSQLLPEWGQERGGDSCEAPVKKSPAKVFLRFG